MKIALIGATGFVGSAILKEALGRGHSVTAIARDITKITTQHNNLTLVQEDVMKSHELAEILKGNEVIISAYNAGWANPNIYNEYLQGSASIQYATKLANVKRLIVIGGAGSSYLKPGLQLIDTPEFPAEWKPGALAARDYLTVLLKENELDWAFLTPAIEMHPGTSGIRKGIYRIGEDAPVFDANNKSVISVEDVAVAAIDEAENDAHKRKRFTVAY